MADFKKLAWIGAAATVTAVTIASPASASVILQTQTLSYSQLTSGGTFNLFNTALGTLTEVKITATPSVPYTASVKNNSTTATVTGTFTLTGQFLYSSALGGLISNLSTHGLFDFPGSGLGLQGGFANTMSFTSPTLTIAPLSTSSPLSGTLGSTYTYDALDGTSLGLFTGAGTTTLALAASASTSGNFTAVGGGATDTSINLANSLDDTVTILYIGSTPVPPPPVGAPEPASMALLGAGLLGLGAAVRRKRRV